MLSFLLVYALVLLYMKRKTIRIVVVMLLAAMAGIITVQTFWFSKAYDEQERQFSNHVNIALRNIADQLLKLNGDATTVIPPIQQQTANDFYVTTNTYIQYSTLDSLLQSTFAALHIESEYHFALYECEENWMVAGAYVFLPEEQDTSAIACASRTLDLGCFNFGVTFPNKSAHLASEMGIWIFSSVVLLLIIAFFLFTMISMIKEKRLSAMKTDFINNMTHELKTPITNISIASEVLRNTEGQLDQKKAQRYADIIYAENQRLKTQVEQVLQIAALESGELKLKKKPLNIHEVIAQLIHTIEPRVQQRKGSIVFTPKAGEHEISADKTHLVNVLYNLIDNADKYSPTAPNITITTRSNKEGILIAVIDKGIGIGKEAQKFIFDKFYRTPTGDVHDVTGFGLGLSYVKTIIEAHGGFITVKSEPRKGSAFEAFFPYV